MTYNQTDDDFMQNLIKKMSKILTGFFLNCTKFGHSTVKSVKERYYD